MKTDEWERIYQVAGGRDGGMKQAVVHDTKSAVITVCKARDFPSSQF